MVRKPCLFNLTNVAKDHKLLEFYDIDVKLIKNKILCFCIHWHERLHSQDLYVLRKLCLYAKSIQCLTRNIQNLYIRAKMAQPCTLFSMLNQNVQVKNKCFHVNLYLSMHKNSGLITWLLCIKQRKGRWTNFLVVNIFTCPLYMGFFSQGLFIVKGTL